MIGRLKVFGAGQLDADVLLRGLEAAGLDGRLQHRADRAGRNGDLRPLGLLLDAGKRQQVLEQGVEPVGLLVHDLQEPLQLGRVVHGAVEQRLDEALDRRDGRAQFVRGVGDEIAADLFQFLQLGHVVQHQQHARLAAAGVGKHGAVDVQDALVVAAEHDLAFAGLLRGQHGVDQAVELAAADQFGKRPALGPGRVDVDQPGRRLVDADDAVFGVEGQDALDHAGEDGLALVALPDDGAELVVQFGGHVVERLGQGADLQRIGHRQAVGQVAAGEALGALLEFFQGPGDAAGMQQAHGRQQPGHQQAPNADVHEDAGEGLVDGGQADRRPHHAEGLAVLAAGHGHVAERLLDGRAGAKRLADAAGQGV